MRTVRGWVVMYTLQVLAVVSWMMLWSVGPAWAQAITWRWDHSLSLPNTAYEKLIVEELPERIKKATDGRLKIDLLVGQLKADQTFYAVRDGRVDGGTLAPVYYGELALWNWTTLPFLVKDREELRKAWAKVDDVIQEDVKRYGLVWAAWGPWARQIIWAARPIRKVDDFKGMKIRSWGGESVTLLKSLGAAPTTMPLAEVYLAMQRNVMDAFTAALGSGYSMKIWEVVKYVNKWPTSQPYWVLLVNGKSWEKLPPELRPKVKEVFESIARESWARTDEEDNALLPRLQEKGMVTVDPEPGELGKLQKISRPVWDEWAVRVGAKGNVVLGRVIAR